MLAVALASPVLAAEPAKTPVPARLAGKPNWTGFWTLDGGLFDRNFGPGYKAPDPAASPVPKAPSADPADLLISPYKERYQALHQKELQGVPPADPTTLCYPPGMPRMMNMTYGMEILEAPNVVAITSEWGPATRRIWLDGRKHPPADELDPTYSGHSIGHWEGEVLVVDTVGLRTEAVLNQSGLMHSEDLHLIERFSSPHPGELVDEITVIDPKVFSKPWTLVRRFGYRPDLSLQEYVCEDNNRNVDHDGRPSF